MLPPLRSPHSSAHLIQGGVGGKEPRVCWALPCTGAGLSQNTGAPRGVAGFIVLSAPFVGDAVQMIPIWKEAKHIKTCHSSRAPGTDLAATAASPRGSYPPRSTLTLVLSPVSLLQPCTAAASCLPAAGDWTAAASSTAWQKPPPLPRPAAPLPSLPLCQRRWPGTLFGPALLPSRSCRAANAAQLL